AADLSAYRDPLKAGSLPTESEEDIGPREMLHERILLGLRSGGLDVRRLHLEFGYDFESRRGELMRWMVQENLALLEREVLHLTPRGFLLCDEICSKLLP
ncbi:MAG TPA: hypothetical protein VEU07_14640, partial [Candidatus Acidoferrum sp.]|nr:hypothetical protein [Candidatus Acidoferrum sp.]